MTVQQRDKIFIDGEWKILLGLPLDDYMPLYAPYIKFTPPSTGCWHGYTAGWALENNVLFLVDFIGYIGLWGESESVDINYLFPSLKKIKAWWFTGTLSIPQGEPVACISDIGDVYEEYLIIQIGSGIETGRYVKRREVNLNDEEVRTIYRKI